MIHSFMCQKSSGFQKECEPKDNTKHQLLCISKQKQTIIQSQEVWRKTSLNRKKKKNEPKGADNTKSHQSERE